jgi:hypothetical protein
LMEFFPKYRQNISSVFSNFLVVSIDLIAVKLVCLVLRLLLWL